MGTISVGGTDLLELDLPWWRRKLGFVGQEPVLFDVSLEENIKYNISSCDLQLHLIIC